MSVEVTYYSDPACPWAYSVSPALATLRWRYGDQLDWRLVTIGLTERAEQYLERGYTPARSARAYIGFRRYGMPFTAAPRRRIAATSRACRALVAVRVRQPGLEFDAFRALHRRGSLRRAGAPLSPDHSCPEPFQLARTHGASLCRDRVCAFSEWLLVLDRTRGG